MNKHTEIALSELEKIRTEKLAAHGLFKDATAVSAARVALDKAIAQLNDSALDHLLAFARAVEPFVADAACNNKFGSKSQELYQQCERIRPLIWTAEPEGLEESGFDHQDPDTAKAVMIDHEIIEIQLRKSLEKSEQDTKRLDWLEKNIAINCRNVFSFGNMRNIDKAAPTTNFREAIDAAMGAQEEETK